MQMSETVIKSVPNASDRSTSPVAMAIFGAAGDLTKRLVVPALYNLARAGRLPRKFSIFGVDHNGLNTETWRRSLSAEMQDFVRKGGGEFQAERIEKPAWDWLVGRMHYLRGDFTDSGTYRELKALTAGQDGRPEAGGNILFYLATADRFFCEIIKQLGQARLTVESEKTWRRVIIEKPFGHDFPSAKALNEGILKILSEDQIYRIDHFLGKEPVQNIMVLRFANGIFEPMWNRDHIDHVQITAAETVGVEERGRFYERTGALRDMVPNHLFQLLAMIAMEPPASFDANAVRRKKTELFQAIPPISPKDAVRGQYGAGTVLGRSVQAYRDEPDVAPNSTTETYVALKLRIDNWRWAAVPFYLRTGKHLPARSTEIAIQFRQAPYALFRDTPVERLPPNILTLRIQPNEGLSVSFSAKRPGPEIKIDGVAMNFSYRDYFEPLAAVGYETLIYDCLNGDASLFQRADTVEAAWYAVQGLIDAWASGPAPAFPNYPSGSAGPAEADRLIVRDGRAWLPIGWAKPPMERKA
jgi:glucose-6-phosphate 1-dehydrogenase